MNLADDSLALKPETVITVVERIVAACQPTSILVFGSRTRGEAVIDSDLDLLVVLPVPVGDHYTLRRYLRKRLEELPLSKDILVTDPDHLAEHSSRINSGYHDAAEGLYLWRDGALNRAAMEEVCRYKLELV